MRRQLWILSLCSCLAVLLFHAATARQIGPAASPPSSDRDYFWYSIPCSSVGSIRYSQAFSLATRAETGRSVLNAGLWVPGWGA